MKIFNRLKFLSLIFFLVMSCTITFSCSHSEPYQNSTVASSSHTNKIVPIILSNNSQATSKGIKILPFSEDLVEIYDIGFKKWIIYFENLKALDYFKCEYKRLLSANGGKEFIPMVKDGGQAVIHPKDQPSVQTKPGKTSPIPNSNIVIVYSERGFLPGEKVTIRGKASDSEDYDMIEFYPRPLLLYDNDGELIAGAELITLNPTQYIVQVAYDPKNPLLRVQSYSGKEHVDNFVYQHETIAILHSPETLDDKGDVSRLKLTYLNGKSYTFFIPWGTELAPYASGAK